MVHVYSTYEAKTKFGELIRRVQSGQRIIISYRGKQVAEVAPLEKAGTSLQASIERLEDLGVLSRARKPTGDLKPLAKRPGALARFLEARE